MTVGELERRMSAAEFVEWQVFYGRRAQRREIEEKKAKGKAAAKRR